MKMMTLRLKPKMIFGLILAVTGIVVMLLSFTSNHLQKEKSVSALISASTDEERRDYLASYGWQVAEDCQERELVIPEKWNKVYSSYNQIQQNQGFDLTDYKGKTVTLYIYQVTNYENINEGVVADMLVCDGKLIGGDICNTSAQDGFLVGFNGET